MNMKLISFLLALLVISITPVFAVQLNLTYDANGNKVVGDDGFYHVYNSLNQLWRVYNGSLAGNLVQEYTYHPTEERVWTKKTFYNNGSLQEEVFYFTKSHVRVVNSSGTFDTRYVYDDGQLVAQKSQNVTLFIVGDNIGSATVVTNSTGGVIENDTYAPFGQQLSNSIVRYGYEAKEQDSVLGDTDFNFRKYNSKTGLFSQPDYLLPNYYNPQKNNRFAFELNNPYSMTDPSGHDAIVVNYNLGMGGMLDPQHSSVVVGNDRDGWNAMWFGTAEGNAYSDGGFSIFKQTRGLVITGAGTTWQSAVQNLETNVPGGGSVGPHDLTTAVRFTTTTTQDSKMTATISQMSSTQKSSVYAPVGSNCANAVQQVLSAGGISTPRSPVTIPSIFHLEVSVIAPIRNVVSKIVNTVTTFISNIFSSISSPSKSKS